MSDFEFYGQGTDNTKVQEVKGITDTVTEYVYTDLAYPCIIFKKGFTCPKHQMKVLSNMVQSKGIKKDITLYFEKDTGTDTPELFKIGSIGGLQVDSLLSIFSLDNLVGFYDESTLLEGDRLFTLRII